MLILGGSYSEETKEPWVQYGMNGKEGTPLDASDNQNIDTLQSVHQKPNTSGRACWHAAMTKYTKGSNVILSFDPSEYASTCVRVDFLIPLEAHNLLRGENFQSLGQGLHILHLVHHKHVSHVM